MDELVRKQDVIDAIHKEWDEVLVFDESGSTIANCCEKDIFMLIFGLSNMDIKKLFIFIKEEGI